MRAYGTKYLRRLHLTKLNLSAIIYAGSFTKPARGPERRVFRCCSYTALWINALFVLWFGSISTDENGSYVGGRVIALIGYRYTYTSDQERRCATKPTQLDRFRHPDGVAALIQLYAKPARTARCMDDGRHICRLLLSGRCEPLLASKGRLETRRLLAFDPKGFMSWLIVHARRRLLRGVRVVKPARPHALRPISATAMSDLLLYGPILRKLDTSREARCPSGTSCKAVKNIPAIMALGRMLRNPGSTTLMLLIVNLATPLYFRWRRNVISPRNGTRRTGKSVRR